MASNLDVQLMVLGQQYRNVCKEWAALSQMDIRERENIRTMTLHLQQIQIKLMTMERKKCAMRVELLSLLEKAGDEVVARSIYTQQSVRGFPEQKQQRNGGGNRGVIPVTDKEPKPYGAE